MIPQRGAAVEIAAGMHNGRRGSVQYVSRNLSTGGHVLHVRLEVPVLVTQPDGPTELVVLPYDPTEVVVADAAVTS